MREETNSGEAVQDRGSRVLELGSRARAGQDHTRRHVANGYMVHANTDEPQYEIESDTTDHVAMHKGSALTKLPT